MKTLTSWGRGVLLLAAAIPALAAPALAADGDGDAEAFKPEQRSSSGSVTVAGRRLDYDAVAGTLVVHLKDWDDVPQNANREDRRGPPEASVFYVAYFKRGDAPVHRPITFLFNGGPGSATLWLHMGAFGPRRVLAGDAVHTPAAPYAVVNNDYSLLDASDLVFIDAPGTGFSRVAGKDHDQAFFGVDADSAAFADFIAQFLSHYQRWNSPKYVLGESYGSTRAAALSCLLETERHIDLNGLILLSQVLNYDVLPDAPELNPGVDEPYELWLPSFAATAWYHHRLPDAPQDLAALVREVEAFASGAYARALQAGAALDPAERARIVAALHGYTGIPASYIEAANLRITQGEFQKTLLDSAQLTTGLLDTRYAGPTMDPMGKEAAYDPQAAAIGSAYVSAFNAYVRKDLDFGAGRIYRPEVDMKDWNFAHQPPGSARPLNQQVNVMPDLAAAMKYNPRLEVLVNAGYFDLVTPFYEAIYEMQHLPVPATLQPHIEFRFYESGHMMYVHEASLRALHENIAQFIRRTGQAGGAP